MPSQAPGEAGGDSLFQVFLNCFHYTVYLKLFLGRFFFLSMSPSFPFHFGWNQKDEKKAGLVMAEYLMHMEQRQKQGDFNGEAEDKHIFDIAWW